MSDPLASPAPRSPSADGAAPIAPAPIEDPTRARLVAIGEIVLCSSIPTQLALQQLLQAAGLSPGEPNRPSFPFIAAQALGDTIILIGLIVFLMRTNGESAKALWLGNRRTGREILVGVLLIPAVFMAVVILLNALRLVAPWLHNVEQNPLERFTATPLDAALFTLVAIVAGGVKEELQRAFLLHRFEQHLGGATVGVVVLSAAFGLGHVIQGWDAVITTGALGAFWAVVYIRRRSSLAPVVSHAGFNSLEILRVALTG